VPVVQRRVFRGGWTSRVAGSRRWPGGGYSAGFWILACRCFGPFVVVIVSIRTLPVVTVSCASCSGPLSGQARAHAVRTLPGRLQPAIVPGACRYEKPAKVFSLRRLDVNKCPREEQSCRWAKESLFGDFSRTFEPASVTLYWGSTNRGVDDFRQRWYMSCGRRLGQRTTDDSKERVCFVLGIVELGCF
jgi:hypothetical protein